MASLVVRQQSILSSFGIMSIVYPPEWEKPKAVVSPDVDVARVLQILSEARQGVIGGFQVLESIKYSDLVSAAIKKWEQIHTIFKIDPDMAGESKLELITHKYQKLAEGASLRHPSHATYGSDVKLSDTGWSDSDTPLSYLPRSRASLFRRFNPDAKLPGVTTPFAYLSGDVFGSFFPDKEDHDFYSMSYQVNGVYGYGWGCLPIRGMSSANSF